MQPNYDIVKKIASFDYGHNSFSAVLDYDDLFQEGCIGLLEAQRKFDPSKGIRFDAFAPIYIKGRITDQRRLFMTHPRRPGSDQTKVLSINETIYEQEKAISLEDILEAKDDTEQEVFVSQLKDILLPSINKLSLRLKEVIVAIYFEDKTGAELAREWNVGEALISLLNRTLCLGQRRLEEGLKRH